MDKTLLWLWLSLHFGEGSYVYGRLLEKYGSIEGIYETTEEDILGQNSVLSDPTDKSKILDKNLSHAIEVKNWCDENGIDIYTYDDEEYPVGLRLIPDFPAVLYCLGNLVNLDCELAIGVVGTRKMTVRGEKTAYNLGYTLSKGGACTVSGMAVGIDSAAHRGTLDAGGYTIAVLGSGINVIYPRANEYLYNRIIENGAVITEYPPNTPPNGFHFPVRNRIISAMCRGVVVVEGGEHSGSMITARLAKKYKKQVFAVPGPGGEYYSAGPNKLIKYGAIVAENAVDILEQYIDSTSCDINLSAAKILPKKKKSFKVASQFDENRFYNNSTEEEEANLARKVIGLFKRRSKEEIKEKEEIDVNDLDTSILTMDELKVYNAMEKGKMMTEENLLHLGYSVSALSVIMFNLEMNGFVKGIPGGFYIKK